MTVLWLLKSYLLTGYWGQYLISPFIAFECSLVVNYWISIRYIWSGRISEQTRHSIRFAEYNLSCAGGLTVKLVAILLIERLFGWDVMWCNVVALAFSGTFNFITQEFLVFRRR